MPSRAVLLLAVAATLPLHAQTEKKPWQYTVEERIALRTDPALARERVRAKARSAQQHSIPEHERAKVADNFNGKTHPELFLPHEVLENLTYTAFVTDARFGVLRREAFMPDVRRHGLPEDFWLRLESLSAAYIATLWDIEDLRKQAPRTEGQARDRFDDAYRSKYLELCRTRADVLNAARREFGHERFDRFLYEVMATKMFYTSDKLPDPALIRRYERGCR